MPLYLDLAAVFVSYMEQTEKYRVYGILMPLSLATLH
jgi:hypothetical protein